jgi:hypothetical protein
MTFRIELIILGAIVATIVVRLLGRKLRVGRYVPVVRECAVASTPGRQMRRRPSGTR